MVRVDVDVDGVIVCVFSAVRQLLWRGEEETGAPFAPAPRPPGGWAERKAKEGARAHPQRLLLALPRALRVDVRQRQVDVALRRRHRDDGFDGGGRVQAQVVHAAVRAALLQDERARFGVVRKHLAGHLLRDLREGLLFGEVMMKETPRMGTKIAASAASAAAVQRHFRFVRKRRDPRASFEHTRSKNTATDLIELCEDRYVGAYDVFPRCCYLLRRGAHPLSQAPPPPSVCGGVSAIQQEM